MLGRLTSTCALTERGVSWVLVDDAGGRAVTANVRLFHVKQSGCAAHLGQPTKPPAAETSERVLGKTDERRYNHNSRPAVEPDVLCGADVLAMASITEPGRLLNGTDVSCEQPASTVLSADMAVIEQVGSP
jgi:hypothetical protein